jgi:hypothetical protein
MFLKLNYPRRDLVSILFGIFLEILRVVGYLAVGKQWNHWVCKFDSGGGGWG